MLVVERLQYSYPFRQIFKDLSFKVTGGEIVQLTGANGAGKSTLMAVLAGLLQEQQGRVSFHWQGLALSDYRHLAEYLPAEANSLYLKLDALENLKLWSRLRGLPLSLKHLEDTLKHWGLSQTKLLLNFPVGKYSTGMKRRLALARVALAGVPLWLLDEPLYGLDQQGIKLWQESLSHHLNQGGMAVVISHDHHSLQGLPVRHLGLNADV